MASLPELFDGLSAVSPPLEIGLTVRLYAIVCIVLCQVLFWCVEVIASLHDLGTSFRSSASSILSGNARGNFTPGPASACLHRYFISHFPFLHLTIPNPISSKDFSKQLFTTKHERSRARATGPHG
jgi:hypothetical protein